MSYPPLHPASTEQPARFVSLAAFKRHFPAESPYVEFKTGTGNQPLQDSIVAFSNADGGVIFVGVNDEGEPVGRELTTGTFDAAWPLHQSRTLGCAIWSRSMDGSEDKTQRTDCANAIC